MAGSPAPFSEIGRRARDLLTKDYNYDQKFILSVPSSTGMGITATGIKKDQIFIGDISTQYRSGRTTVDVKVDTYSNLDVHYFHRRAAINSSIGLNPTPLLEVAAAVGSKDIAIGGEISFDTASSFTKCNAGISFNKPDFSAAFILTDKGQTIKASYLHSVNHVNGTEIAQLK